MESWRDEVHAGVDGPPTRRVLVRVGRRTRRRRTTAAGRSLALWMMLPIVGGSLIDLPRLSRSGPLTGLGALTLAYVAVGTGVLGAAARYPRRLGRVLLPYGALVGWAALTMLWTAPAADAWPTLLAYVVFGVLVAAAGTVTAVDRERVASALRWAMLWYDLVGLSIAAVSIARHGFAIMQWVSHPRALALAAAAPVAWHLSEWDDGRPRALIPVALWTAAAMASLSRTATAVMVALAILATVLHRSADRRAAAARWQRSPLLLVVAVAVAAVTITPFRQRLDTEDRTALWAGVASSALTAPLLGHGLGSSESSPVLRYWYVRPPATDPRRHPWSEYWWVHPHNEFLRAWHDLGVPGALLLAATFGLWGRTLDQARRRARVADRSNDAPPDPSLRLIVAALLALVGLGIAMLADNPLVYPFISAPAAVLIGVGLGAASTVTPSRSHRRRQRP